MLTARWAASCSSANARRLSPRSRGVSPAATITVPVVGRPRASIAMRTACPVPSWVSWTASTASGTSSLDVRPDLVALVADDGDDPLRLDGLHGAQHVPDHAASADGVQHLHRLGLHAGAPAGGEDDHGEVVHGAQSASDLGAAPPPAVARPADRGGVRRRAGDGAHAATELAPRVGVEPTSLVLIQSQAGPAGRPTGDRRQSLGPRVRGGRDLHEISTRLRVHSRCGPSPDPASVAVVTVGREQ